MPMVAPGKTSRGPEPEPDPRPFSVVLAPAAVMQLGGCGALVRHLHVEQAEAARHWPPRLSGVVVVVRAQPCALHLFRGRRLCRVVEFSSPVVDVTGLPLARSPPIELLPSGILCISLCRDGTAYALPTAEVLEAAPGASHPTPARNESRRSSGVPAVATASSSKPGRSSTTLASSVGVFDDLAPAFLTNASSSPEQTQRQQQQQQQQQQQSAGGGDGGSASDGVSSSGLVIRAQERWVVFNHLGAKTVAACAKGAAVAVAGIIDRAALYGLPSRLSGERSSHTSRCLGTLGGIDGAAPTTSCLVWIADIAREEETRAGGNGAWGDCKGFPLPSPVFRALFGAELVRAGGAVSLPPVSQPPQPAAWRPAVVLVGDEAGTVRWSPVPAHPTVTGGVLANLGTAIASTLPQLDAGSNVIGLLVVGADGAIVSITAGANPGRVSRKRARPHDELGGRQDGGGDGKGGGASAEEGANAGATDSLSICRRSFKVPFPVASACSAPGYLVHCHAGALFASAIPAEAGVETNQADNEGWPNGGRWVNKGRHTDGLRRPPAGSPDVAYGPGPLAAVLPLRPVRLPLPCETVALAAAPVLTEGQTGAAADRSSAVTRTLVMSLSGRGRLAGFLAPRSADELEGWALDTGKGGVRVGGNAGVERRVRCQLERLSSVGRQCTALSTESAERDLEFRTLRGAADFLPTLVAGAAPRRGGGGSRYRDASSALGHSVSMEADEEQNASFDEGSDGGAGQSEVLRVRLRVRLWTKEGGRASELPGVGEDGPGRWFIVTQIVVEGDGGGGGGAAGAGAGAGAGAAAGEGWAWSMSAPVPMASLRQGCPWGSSLALSLPSARPVAVTSWLQFRFGEDAGGGDSDGVAGDDAAGVCVELGTSRFDALDWAVRLLSVPGSAAALRAAALGRGGSCFCGPEQAIADVLERTRTASSGGAGTGRAGPEIGPAPRLALSADGGNFQLRLMSSDVDAGAMLDLLVPVVAPPRSADEINGGAPVARGRGAPAELALRMAGQVVAMRAKDCTVPAGAAGDGAGHATATGPRAVDIAVMCSHEAMAPLVREALVSRARVLALAPPTHRGAATAVETGGGGIGEVYDGGVFARGDAAARLVREIHPMAQAVADVSDAATALGAARASDGPTAETAKEALALMCRVREVYQALRRQQEAVGST